MSRTVHDLEDRLSMLEPGVGAGDQIEAYARHVASRPPEPARVSQGRRVAGLAALSAAALVTAAVVLIAAALAPDETDGDDRAGTSAGPLPPPDPSGISWRWLFSIDALPEGWSLMAETIQADRQEASLVLPNSFICTIQVYDAGAYDASRIDAGAEAVSVNGAEGSYWPAIDASSHRVDRTLAWQYAPGAYALSICDQRSLDVRADELSAASALTARQRPFTVPFAVGYLPAGLIADMAFAGPGSTGGVRGSLTAWGPGQGASIVLDSRIPDAGVLDRAEPLTVNTLDGPREAGFLQEGGLFVAYEGFRVWVGGGTSPSISSAEMIRIAENLTVAPDPLDISTWFDAQDALP